MREAGGEAGGVGDAQAWYRLVRYHSLVRHTTVGMARLTRPRQGRGRGRGRQGG